MYVKKPDEIKEVHSKKVTNTTGIEPYEAETNSGPTGAQLAVCGFTGFSCALSVFTLRSQQAVAQVLPRAPAAS